MSLPFRFRLDASHRRPRFSRLALYIFVVASFVASQAGAEPDATLAPIVVDDELLEDRPRTVRRSKEVENDTTGFVESIDLRSVWRSTESLPEILNRSTGIRVRSQGGREHRSTLSVRGSRAGQVRVLLDGVPLGLADDPVVDLATLPAGTIDKIDLHRGFTPLRYAAGGGASVLYINSRTPEKPEYGASLSYGSFGTGTISSRLATPAGGGHLGLSLGFRKTDGDYDFFDNRGTPFDKTDDRTRPRENNATETVDLSASWVRKLRSGQRLVLRNSLLEREEGVPGQGVFDFPTLGLDTLRNSFSTALEGQDWSLAASLLFVDRELRATSLDQGANSADTQSWTANFGGHLQRVVADRHLLEVAVDGFHEKFDSSNPESSGSGRRQERDSFSLAIGDELALAGGQLIVALQIRHQQIWNRFEGGSITEAGLSDDPLELPQSHTHSTDPRLGLRWSALPWLELKSNLSTWFRPPTFSELFGADGFSFGSPDLKPEDGLSFDAGFALSTALGTWDLDFEYAWFANDTDDMIVIVLNSFRIPEARNIDNGEVRGHELSLSLDGPSGWNLSGNYTYQDARNVSPNAPSEFRKRLPSVAAQEFAARLEFRQPMWVVAWESQFKGEHFTDVENASAQRIGSRLQHDLSLTLAPWGDWQLAIELDNLTNTLVPDDLGFPLPSRSVFATLSWESRSRP